MSETTANSESAAARPEWTKAQRIVVKIGSALLTDRATGQLKAAWLASLMDDVAALAKAGKEVILVSSGAMALGRHKLGLPKGPLELEQSQAAAAVGQISLAHAYQNLAAGHGLIIAQILLTLGDTEERRRYLNARHTIETLLELKAIPVVNENDTVATAEIRYGDNDRLSARVASMMSADCLVLLSDIDGLYTAPPASDSAAKHIPLVTEITAEIEAMAGDAGTELSKGGMKTKIEAAKIAVGAGTNMVITTGKIMNPLAAIGAGSTVHMVPGQVGSGDREEALDRGSARAARRAARGRGRRAGAELGQEPAAGRREARRGRVRPWRRRDHPCTRRARAGARPCRLRPRRRGAHHRPEILGDPRHPGLRRRAGAHPPRRHGPAALKLAG